MQSNPWNNNTPGVGGGGGGGGGHNGGGALASGSGAVGRGVSVGGKVAKLEFEDDGLDEESDSGTPVANGVGEVKKKSTRGSRACSK